jgi:hypothetical protein
LKEDHSWSGLGSPGAARFGVGDKKKTEERSQGVRETDGRGGGFCFFREVEKFHLGFWDHGDPCMDACVMHFVDISMQ